MTRDVDERNKGGSRWLFWVVVILVVLAVFIWLSSQTLVPKQSARSETPGGVAALAF